MRKRFLLAIMVTWAAWVFDVAGQVDATLPPELRGQAIAEEAERRGAGFGDTVTELTMILTNDEGRERKRRLTWWTLETVDPGEGDKSLTLFHEPRDIEGVAFLSHTHMDRDDDQWLYLPSLKRVKRIASSNKSGAFVGSQFAYEDLLSDELERFEYRWLNDESCGELQCYVIERLPRYENSGYSRQTVWMDQNEYRPMKIQYFDREEQLLKTLVFDDYRLYLDRFWRAHELRMENLQTRKTTILTFETFQFGTGLSDREFDPDALRNLRR